MSGGRIILVYAVALTIGAFLQFEERATGRDRRKLVCVADQNDTGVVLLGDLDDASHFDRSGHAGFVQHDDAVLKLREGGFIALFVFFNE